MTAVAGDVANEVPDFQALLNKVSVEEVEVEVEVVAVVVGANLSGSKVQDPAAGGAVLEVMVEAYRSLGLIMSF